MRTPEGKRYQAGWNRMLPIGLGVWFALLGAVLLVVVPEWPIKLAAAGCNFMVAAFCFLRFARVGPMLDGHGVRIVKLFSTRQVPWADVRKFVVRVHAGAGPAAHLERTDGSMIWLQGVGSSSVFAKSGSAELDSVVDEMNRFRHRYQAPPHPTQGVRTSRPDDRRPVPGHGSPPDG